MIPMLPLRIVIPVFSGCVIVTSLYAADVIDSRIQFFKAMKATVSAIDDALSDGKLDVAGAESRKLARSAATLPDLFPPGSGRAQGRSTKASDGIWSHFPDFETKAGALRITAEDLAVAAEAGDREAARAKLDAVRSTCKACHRSYKDFW